MLQENKNIKKYICTPVSNILPSLSLLLRFCQGVLPFHRKRMRKRWIMWTRYSSCGPFVSNMALLSTPCWVLWQGRPPSLRKCIIRVQHIKLSIASFRQRDGDFLDALLTLEELFRAFISVAMQPWNNKLIFCAIFLWCANPPPMLLLHSRLRFKVVSAAHTPLSKS